MPRIQQIVDFSSSGLLVRIDGGAVVAVDGSPSIGDEVLLFSDGWHVVWNPRETVQGPVLAERPEAQESRALSDLVAKAENVKSESGDVAAAVS